MSADPSVTTANEQVRLRLLNRMDAPVDPESLLHLSEAYATLFSCRSDEIQFKPAKEEIQKDTTIASGSGKVGVL